MQQGGGRGSRERGHSPVAVDAVSGELVGMMSILVGLLTEAPSEARESVLEYGEGQWSCSMSTLRARVPTAEVIRLNAAFIYKNNCIHRYPQMKTVRSLDRKRFI